jgi:predicted transcriptional regulator
MNTGDRSNPPTRRLRGTDVYPPYQPPGERSAGRDTVPTPSMKPSQYTVVRRMHQFNYIMDNIARTVGKVEFKVLMGLFRDTKRNGTARTAQTDLATRLDLSRKAVGEALVRLEDRGLVKRLKKGSPKSGPSQYRLLTLPMSEDDVGDLLEEP